MAKAGVIKYCMHVGYVEC